MAITNGYATLAEIKAELGGVDDSDDDSRLEIIVEAISRTIDLHCGRRFYAASETRYYTPEFTDMLIVDDLLSVTTLKADSTGDRVYNETWSATDYDLLPLNATLDGYPYTRIEITPNGTKSFPVIRKSVELTGSFGYSATTPPMINRACLLTAEQLFKRADTIFGVVGTIGGEQIMQMAEDVLRSDPHISMLLDPFVRVGVLAV